jgi:hypothetical protein
MASNVTSDKRWPPESAAARFEKIRDYRRRYTADAGELFSYRTDLHIREDPRATADKAATFTPVPLARDLARYSAQLLFSESPKVTVEGDVEQAALDALSESNALPAFLHDAADNIASEGSGGLRVIQDDDVNQGRPILSYEPADTLLWRTHYGRFTEGGVVVLTRERDGAVYRLLEDHSPGLITRLLYKGSLSRLGQSVGLSSLPEFRDLRDQVRTGLSRPTLIRWDNVPGGASDQAGIEALLDELDTGESIGREKLEASKALKFVNRRLADEQGGVDLSGVILLDTNMNPVETPASLAEIVQPSMQADDHVTYLNHVRELAVTMAGYSLASWGLDHGGSADSGKALKLRQSRTLLTRAGKERMAVGAIGEALSVALEMVTGGVNTVSVELGDGLPVDTLEQAQELDTLAGAGLISKAEAVKRLHPEWDEAQVEEEIANLVYTRDSAEQNELTRARQVINS